MKTNFRWCALGLGLCASSLRVSHADTPAATIVSSGAATLGDSARATAASPWRDQGVLSTDEIIKMLGVPVTPEQRAQLDRAVAQRNLALQAANAQFSAAIFQTLRTNDAELSKTMMDEKERQKLDRIRRFQPSRYDEIMRQKKKN